MLNNQPLLHALYHYGFAFLSHISLQVHKNVYLLFTERGKKSIVLLSSHSTRSPVYPNSIYLYLHIVKD